MSVLLKTLGFSLLVDTPIPGDQGLSLPVHRLEPSCHWNQRFGCTGVAAEPPYGNCAHFHAAIDIGAQQGSSVVAAGGGTVIYAGWKLAGSDGYGGGLVVLDRRRRNGVNATKPARFDALAVRLERQVRVEVAERDDGGRIGDAIYIGVSSKEWPTVGRVLA